MIIGKKIENMMLSARSFTLLISNMKSKFEEAEIPFLIVKSGRAIGRETK